MRFNILTATACVFAIKIFSPSASSQTLAPAFSDLWGEDGEYWFPQYAGEDWYPESLIENGAVNPSALPDFTNVGYMNGNVPIPDWPVGVNIKEDYGAVGDGVNDDTQAFRDAIANCPPNTAIFVPNGRYRITDRILIEDKNNFVLRGEDMYNTVLWFPTNLGEIYPEVDHSKGGGYAFFTVRGGTHRSIENFTFEFKEERMETHFNNSGAAAIYYRVNGNQRTQDSWIRNIYIKNANDGILVNGERITIMNIILDQYQGRPSEEEATVGHHGIFLTDARRCLIHNVFITGKWQHEMGTGGDDRFNVFSRITTMVDSQIDHHAQNAGWNLWTEIDMGEGHRIWSQSSYETASTDDEFYWNITADEAMLYPPTSRGNVAVGFKTDMPTDIGSDYRHETIDPDALTPTNLYIAQMEKKGKPIPGPTIELPEWLLPDPNIIMASDDAYVNNRDRESTSNAYNYDRGAQMELKHGNSIDRVPYFRFDLSAIEFASVNTATLRIYCNGWNQGSPLAIQAVGVANDAWDEHTLNYNNQPRDLNDAQIAVTNVDAENKWYEWDITTYVNQELANDKVVSLYLDDVNTTDRPSFWRTKEGAIYHPQIAITPENGTVLTDKDDDGMNDSWEELYFETIEAKDGSVDSDGDGVIDFFEYLYGSVPTDFNSNGFQLQIELNTSTNAATVNWAVKEGFEFGQDYKIEVSSNMLSWDALPSNRYTLSETTENGKTHLQLELTNNYGDTVFFQLVKP